MNRKFCLIVFLLACACNVNKALAQEPQAAPPMPNEQQVTQEEKKKSIFFHTKEEIDKIRQEREAAKQQKEQARAQLNIKRNLSKKIQEERLKNTGLAREHFFERRKEIRTTKKTDRFVEISRNEDDPLYIVNAEVLKDKTDFLGIKDIQFSYKVELLNQTPKIINTVLIIWERRIPFTESLTIAKQTKISKPITPYEKRIVKYKDLDSKREGEEYRVKIAKVIFEDGTQWKNPTLAKNEL